MTAFTHVTLQQRGELPVLQIANRHAEAAIALQGGQVLEYTPRGAKPVIWLSEQAEYRRGQSIRGGIPICWPWFGDIACNPNDVQAMVRGENLPAHGLVRGRDWALRSVREGDGTTDVTLGFVTDYVAHKQWPHAAELELWVSVGRSLGLQLTTRNLGTEPVVLTQALHTYFAISDIGKLYISGFEGAPYVDALDDWRTRTQEGMINFSGETDRVYLDVPDRVQLGDDGWDRVVTVASRHSRSAIVWNPWIEKSKRLSQFASDAWRGMACIETANALKDRVKLAPGAAATLALEVAATSR